MGVMRSPSIKFFFFFYIYIYIFFFCVFCGSCPSLPQRVAYNPYQCNGAVQTAFSELMITGAPFIRKAICREINLS